MNRIRFSTALRATLVVIGFGMWSTVVMAPPAVAATITKSAILEDPLAPKVYAEPTDRNQSFSAYLINGYPTRWERH